MRRKHVWQIAHHGVGTKAVQKLLNAGWEPFAVTGGIVHLRRQVWK